MPCWRKGLGSPYMWYLVLSVSPFAVSRIMVSQIIIPDEILMLSEQFNRSPICTLVFLGSQPNSLSLTNIHINSPINPQHSYFLPSIQSVYIIYLIVGPFFPTVNLVCLTQLFQHEVYLKADLFCTEQGVHGGSNSMHHPDSFY